MKNQILISLIALAFGGCATFHAKTVHHTAAISAPSVAPVKSSITAASRASEETSRQISSIKRGTETVDFKAGRALRFFP